MFKVQSVSALEMLVLFVCLPVCLFLIINSMRCFKCKVFQSCRCRFYSWFVCLFVCFFAVSCRQYFEDGYEIDGVYKLFVDGPCEKPVKTVCDQSRRFGGGWTLLVKSYI